METHGRIGMEMVAALKSNIMNFIENFEVFGFTCFRATINEIEEVLQSKFGANAKYMMKKKSFLFDLYLKRPPKGGAHLIKAYFFVPSSNSSMVVMVTNYNDEWQTLANYIVNELKLDAFSFHMTSDMNISDARNSFTHWANGNKARVVYAMKDPKWIFYEEGDPLWLENIEFYKRKIIKDRLNHNILISYCQELNLNIIEKSFWKNNHAILLEKIA
ncbi:hypothetical protein G6M24_24820 [Agrobacterium tumefaciens]|nr:hypothetical protein [Agrobacterium tumefaciens]